MDNPQHFLNEIADNDTHNFLHNVSGWNDHRSLLYLALNLTNDCADPVIEYGSGEGSSGYLRAYCLDHDRPFFSYDSDKDWANKTGATFIEDWDKSDVFDGQISVAFVDHAPGEHRHIAMEKLANKADIVVIHDSEKIATGYMLDKIWHLYKYRLNYNIEGACAAMVSNKIDVTVFDNLKLGDFLLETRIQ